MLGNIEELIMFFCVNKVQISCILVVKMSIISRYAKKAL